MIDTMTTRDWQQEEQIQRNFEALRKSQLETESKKEYYRTHCPICNKTWNETNCGMVQLVSFGRICVCGKCYSELDNGLPTEAEERFEEASRLFNGAVPWRCNNGRLWVKDMNVPYHLRTTTMQRVMNN